MHKWTFLIFVAALAITRGAGAEPTAEERDKAAGHVFAGDEKREAGDHQGALQEYEKADEIMAVPSTGIEVARALVRLGKLKEAKAKAAAVQNHPKKDGEPKAFARAREQAKQLQADLDARIPRIQIVIEGSDDATVEVDGELVTETTLRLNPGEHTFVARAKATSARATITFSEGDDREVKLVLEPHEDKEVALPPPSKPIPPAAPEEEDWEMPILAWVGFGVGGAGIVAGAITGILTLTTTSDLDTVCTDRVCGTENLADVDRAVVLSHVSTITFAVGGAGVAVGAVALILSLTGGEDAEASASVMPMIGPGMLGARGTF